MDLGNIFSIVTNSYSLEDALENVIEELLVTYKSEIASVINVSEEVINEIIDGIINKNLTSEQISALLDELDGSETLSNILGIFKDYYLSNDFINQLLTEYRTDIVNYMTEEINEGYFHAEESETAYIELKALVTNFVDGYINKDLNISDLFEDVWTLIDNYCEEPSRTIILSDFSLIILLTQKNIDFIAL